MLHAAVRLQVRNMFVLLVAQKMNWNFRILNAGFIRGNGYGGK